MVRGSWYVEKECGATSDVAAVKATPNARVIAVVHKNYGSTGHHTNSDGRGPTRTLGSRK